jgi:hypothetical protein
MAQDTASHISDTSNWPTLTEAAVRLGSNERTIRRWIDGGQLRAASRPIPGRKPATIVNPDDIERVRAERRQAVTVTPDIEAAPSASNDPAEPAAPALALQTAALKPMLQLFAAIQAGRALDQKPWLTLDEAAEASGLPKAWLLAQARKDWRTFRLPGDTDAQADCVRAINVGSEKHCVWRFSRAALMR